jgi:hypothetical protein
MKKFDLYLISDSTGETVCNIARAVTAQFVNVETTEHVWSLIRTKAQLEKVIHAIEKKPGVVMFTIVEKELAEMLKLHCHRLSIPCIPVLSRAIADLSAYLNMKATPQPGRQHELDDSYFTRVEAVNFAISHDDGQTSWDIDEADIVLVGVSRTSKSPTCMYLAHRGYRTANIPYILGCDLPYDLSKLKKPLVVALTISCERLVQIRKSRVLALNSEENSEYTNIEIVRQELEEAKKFFIKNKWPIIDVTRKSVEETAALVIQYHHKHKNIQN